MCGVCFVVVWGEWSRRWKRNGFLWGTGQGLSESVGRLSLYLVILSPNPRVSRARDNCASAGDGNMSFHAGPRLLASAVQGSPRVYFPVWTWVPTVVATPDFELPVNEARPTASCQNRVSFFGVERESTRDMMTARNTTANDFHFSTDSRLPSPIFDNHMQSNRISRTARGQSAGLLWIPPCGHGQLAHGCDALSLETIVHRAKKRMER